MHPLFYNANEPLAMLYGSEAAYRAGRRSRRDWPDDDRESRERLHEEIEAPSWDDEAFSRCSRALPVDPVWGTSLSSETAQSEYQEDEKTTSSASWASACHDCTKHGSVTAFNPPSLKRLFSAGGKHGNPPVGPSNIRLLGLTALAALLVVVVVATNAKTNCIILGPLDSEPPDATRQAKLIDRKASATEHGLPAIFLPGFARDDVERPAEAGGNGAEPTAIADDVVVSSSDADVTVNEYEDLTRRSGTPQTSTSFSGDESNAGRLVEGTSVHLQSNMTKPNCQAVVYTYCPVARREFHYRFSVNACLATALDPMVQLCARGFNRFTSRATCEHSCVFGYRPKDACFDMPLFSGCEREDVRESWWDFESDRCRPWRFPAGACPSNDSALFSTAAECASRCGAHGSALCGRVPRATSCSRNQLRLPYFAHFSPPEGRVRSLRTSAVLEAALRCVAGDNRFASLADCAEACAAKASGSDHRDQGT